jgi:hypothetical protein
VLAIAPLVFHGITLALIVWSIAYARRSTPQWRQRSSTPGSAVSTFPER